MSEELPVRPPDELSFPPWLIGPDDWGPPTKEDARRSKEFMHNYGAIPPKRLTSLDEMNVLAEYDADHEERIKQALFPDEKTTIQMWYPFYLFPLGKQAHYKGPMLEGRIEITKLEPDIHDCRVAEITMSFTETKES